MAEVSLVFKATVVLAAALLAARVAGRAPASVRALVLASAFAVLLVLPLAIVAIPPRTVEIPVSSMPGLLEEDAFEASPASVASPSTNSAPPQTFSFRMPSLAAMVRVAWATGTLLFIAPIVVALWRLRRLRLTGLPWLDGRALVAAVAAHSGLARPVDVFLHEALAAPMTCGFFRPAIGLPIDAPHWTEADLRHALVHETEHVRRHDWPVHLLARVTCALYWCHPLVWFAWRQLCLESERACDDAVVRGAEGTAYAEQLVSLARRLSKHSPVPMLSMADRSNLSTRVTAVLDSRLARGRAGLLSALLIVGAAVAIALTLSPLHAVTTTNDAPAVAPQAAADARFELASIRRNTSNVPLFASPRMQPGGRMVATNVSLHLLVRVAYNLEENQIVGGPAWVTETTFDLAAQASPTTTMEQARAMLRTLLAERFRLATHIEQRQLPVYVLFRESTDRLGPQLRRSGADCAPPRTSGALGGGPVAGPGGPPPPPGGTPLGVRGAGGSGCGWNFAPGELSARASTMDALAGHLSQVVDRPVINRTALDGTFDIDLSYAVLDPAAGGDVQSASAAPSIVTALREQLRLRLDADRAPVDVLVIDRVEPPTSNDAPAAQAPQASIPVSAFDVVSVRRNVSGEQVMRGPLVQPGNRVVAQNIAVRFLITTAYSIEFNQIVGAPPWIDTDRFDIDARARPDASPAELKAMLRALLADRFRLAAHFESQERPIYTLVRARSDGRTGPTLRPSGPDCAPIVTPAGGTLPPPPPPPPPPPRPGQAAPPVDVPLTATSEVTGCSRMFFPGFIGARNISLRDFANSLTNFARRRVVDGTGLTGLYDIDLKFAVEGLPPGAPQAPPDDNVPTLLTAVEEQLGLRLEPGRAAVQVLVLDGIEPPTPN